MPSRRLSGESGLELVGVNLHAGDMPAGERGFLNLPERRAAVLANAEEAIGLAQRLETPNINALSGILTVGTGRPRSMRSCGALGELGALADGTDVSVLVEPLNDLDSPGYLVNTPDEAAELIARVGHPDVAMLFDAFQVARMGLDPVGELERHPPLVRHVQIADAPGRHAPGTGTSTSRPSSPRSSASATTAPSASSTCRPTARTPTPRSRGCLGERRMRRTSVSFIGLGVMGRPMAGHLVEAGYDVRVHNRSRGAVEELAALGARPLDEPAEAGRARFVITMLPDSPDVRAVAERAHPGAQEGTIWIDMSTISPVVTRELEAQVRCARRGDAGRAGLRRRQGRARRDAVDHGRRPRGGLRAPPCPSSRCSGRRSSTSATAAPVRSSRRATRSWSASAMQGWRRRSCWPPGRCRP